MVTMYMYDSVELLPYGHTIRQKSPVLRSENLVVTISIWEGT